MKFSKIDVQNLIQCASQPFDTEYGEKVGDYSFSPLRKYTFTERGIKRWYWPRLVIRPTDGTGFAAINLGDEPSEHENILIPAKRLVLVAHAFETLAARIYVTSPGTYFIAAVFSPVGFEGPYHVNLCVNGRRVWTSTATTADCTLQHTQFVRMNSTGFIDFAINTDRAAQTVPSRTFIQYAVIRCDDLSGALLQRYDDRGSDLPENDIIAMHTQTSVQILDCPAPFVSIEDRAALFEKEWTLHREYIESQYQCSPKQLIERVLSNRDQALIKYCIFMIPRSGSTLLTELLASTGQLGFPGESFVPDVIRTMSLTFLDQFHSYEEFLLTGLRTANGVFGIEVEHGRLLEEHRFFADVATWRHIYIWRKDLLAQAISYQLSIETGIWHTFVGAEHDDAMRFISRSAILDQINYLLQAERFFQVFFAKFDMSPFSVCFEDLISDPVGQAKKIADHIGIDSAQLDFVDHRETLLRPTSRARNAYYKQQTISTGGELWGYDIHRHDKHWAAVLHGVDLALLNLDVEREPVLFVAEDRNSLCDKVDAFVVRHIASLPALKSSN